MEPVRRGPVCPVIAGWPPCRGISRSRFYRRAAGGTGSQLLTRTREKPTRTSPPRCAVSATKLNAFLPGPAPREVTRPLLSSHSGPRPSCRPPEGTPSRPVRGRLRGCPGRSQRGPAGGAWTVRSGQVSEGSSGLACGLAAQRESAAPLFPCPPSSLCPLRAAWAVFPRDPWTVRGLLDMCVQLCQLPAERMETRAGPWPRDSGEEVSQRPGRLIQPSRPVSVQRDVGPSVWL